MLKIQCTRMNGVARIARTHIHTHAHTALNHGERDKTFFLNLKVHFLDIYRRTLFPKFECNSLNGMAIIARKDTKNTDPTKLS